MRRVMWVTQAGICSLSLVLVWHQARGNRIVNVELRTGPRHISGPRYAGDLDTVDAGSTAAALAPLLGGQELITSVEVTFRRALRALLCVRELAQQAARC